jgi:putative oxidoreductase
MANGGMGMADGAKLILRVTLGFLILFHGVSKILHGVGPITGMVGSHGLPPAVGYLVYVGEVIAPLMLVFGIWTRLAALVVVINMVVAVLLVHVSQFFTLGNAGGWALELQAMYLMTALAIVLLGAGRYSVGGSSGRWN